MARNRVPERQMWRALRVETRAMHAANRFQRCSRMCMYEFAGKIVVNNIDFGEEARMLPPRVRREFETAPEKR